MVVTNILIPVAGKAQRFLDAGFTAPKPLIVVKDKHMIEWALDSVDHTDCHLIFVVRKDHIQNHSIDQILKSMYGADISIVVVDQITQGTLCTCLLAENLINNNDPLLIYTPDVTFTPKFDPKTLVDSQDDGFLLTFKANSPAHSYASLDADGFVVKTAEKDVISSDAAVGAYYFKRGSDFVKHANEMVGDKVTTNGEYYVCPVYNSMIRDGAKVRIQQVEKMHVLGTPPDVDFFTKNTLNIFGEQPVALCCDHSGYELKEQMKSILSAHWIRYIDFGTYGNHDCDYYDFLSQAIRHMKQGLAGFGMGFCRTGQGLNIAANKTPGIRSALICDDYTAEYAIRHNCANFLCLPSKYVDKSTLKSIIHTLKRSSFDGGRHMTRINKIEYGVGD